MNEKERTAYMNLSVEVARLRADLSDMRNELCEYCGKYCNAHEGACDGCRWKER